MLDALLLLITTVLKIVAIILPLLISVAYLTLAERKVIGSMQVRVGPNRVGWKGLGQPFADLFKLLTNCLLYTSPSPRDKRQSRMPSSA